MTFYISSVTDSSVKNDDKVLPVLHMDLIWDGRHDFSKFYEAIQNATITFSMIEDTSGVYKVANKPAFVVPIEDEGCTTKYEICYQFIKREVSAPGNYTGQFMIKFGDDLKNDDYEYPSGVLSMPIRDDLHIVVR